jgi:DNA polymerase-3 subunit epsilon
MLSTKKEIFTKIFKEINVSHNILLHQMTLNLIRPLVFFDLETTGTDVANDRIVEISLLKLFPDVHEELYTFRINPGIPIPREVTAIHGISDTDVADKPSFSELSSILVGILSNSDLCGYNLLKFDFPLLRMEFARNKIEFNTLGIKLIDPMRIFMKNEPRDLTAALKFYCNEDLTNAHSAEADTIATKKILLAQIKKYDDVPDSISELSAYSTEGQKRFADITGKLLYNERNEIIFSFGKHKGERVVDNADYCGWVLGADFPEDTKTIIRQLLNVK